MTKKPPTDFEFPEEGNFEPIGNFLSSFEIEGRVEMVVDEQGFRYADIPNVTATGESLVDLLRMFGGYRIQVKIDLIG